MASPLDMLLDSVKNAITDHSAQQGHTGFDPSGLLGKVTELFGAHKQSGPGNPKPASEDPYGDPADQGNAGGRKIKPASQDPYGDPANQK